MKTLVQIRERVADTSGLLGQRVENHVGGKGQAQVWHRVEGQVENGLWRSVRETLKEYVAN